MEEREQEFPAAGGHELASEVGERVRSVISAAEAAANAVRHEAEQEGAVRRRVAEEEARRIVDDAKADADAFLAERVRRISDLSDTLVERAEAIVSRLDRAEDVRRQLQTLADSLGESAEDLANEVRRGHPPPTVASSAPPPPPAPPSPPAPETTFPSTAAEPAAPPAEADDDEGAIAEEPAAEEPASESTVAEASADESELDAPPPGAPGVVHLDDQRTAPDAPRERREPDDQLSARLVALQMAVAGGNRGEVEVHLKRTFSLSDPAPILDDVFGQGTDADKRVAWPRSGDGAA